MLQNLINEDLIFIHQTFKNESELFDHVQSKASELQLVTNEFSKKLAEREQVFPTGLELEGTNVAIPHTDPEFVKEQFIAVYTLDQPISFKRMDDPNQTTDVSVVFVLGLNEPHAQLEVLQELMKKMQDQTFINGIKDLTNKSEIKAQF